MIWGANVSHDCDGECMARHAMCVAEGEIDLASAEELRRLALDAMDRHRPTLTLDLSRVTFMDCSGLGVLVLLHTEASARGGHVTLTGSSKMIRRLLRLSGLDVRFGLARSAA